MNDPVAIYFGAERAESLLFICIGLVALEVAYLCWRKSRADSARGAAMVLVLVAALQLTVGTTIFMRGPGDKARVSQALRHDKPALRAQELPRMQRVMRSFQIYRWIELGLLALGVLLAWAAHRGSTARGAGLALMPQAAVMLVFDGLAEQRGAVYLAWLNSLL